jgi:hypothetical protein
MRGLRASSIDNNARNTAFAVLFHRRNKADSDGRKSLVDQSTKLVASLVGNGDVPGLGT